MFYRPPKKPRLAVVFTRDDPEHPDPMSAELQEERCLQYCSSVGLPVSHTVRARCSSEESLELMRLLLRSMPGEVDSLFAARFSDYSYLAPQLARLCLLFQCRRTWVYTLDNIGPLYKYLPGLRAEDFTLADQRFEALIKQKEDAE